MSRKRLTSQERFVKEVKWMAARLGIIPDKSVAVETDGKILYEGRKAFEAGEYRKCRRILLIRNSKNPRKGWEWLYSLKTTDPKHVKLPSLSSGAAIRRQDQLDRLDALRLL